MIRATPILVSDFIIKLDALDLMSRKILNGKMKGERRSKRRGQSVEFADYRNYTSGDDLRFIDWNILARLDKLFIKLFQEEEDLALHIIVDASKSMTVGDPQKALWARQVAAAVGYVGLVNYNRVTITAVGEEKLSSSGGLRGRARVPRLIDFVEKITFDGSQSLSTGLKRVALTHRSKGVVLVVSDFFDKTGFDSGLKYLLAGNSDVFTLHCLSPQEVDPTFTGDLRLRDIEDSDTAEVSLSKPLLDRYQSNLKSFCLSLKNYVTARGGTYLFSRTDVSFETVVLSYLREKRFIG